jgi:hypothetical protein
VAASAYEEHRAELERLLELPFELEPPSTPDEVDRLRMAAETTKS